MTSGASSAGWSERISGRHYDQALALLAREDGGRDGSGLSRNLRVHAARRCAVAERPAAWVGTMGRRSGEEDFNREKQTPQSPGRYP
jgi:hypothetical protein